MTTKKNLIIVVLATFCLTLTLFVVIPTRSAGVYDPWLDVNDDGMIELMDFFELSNAFGTSGTPINKTALLYNVNDTFTELLSRIDSLNASLLDLEAYFETRINTLNATLLESQNTINELNTTVLGLQARALITWNSTYVNSAATTETLSWQPVSGLSVDINVNQTCYLLVMFSTMAYSYIDQFASGQIWIHAKVDSATISPDWLYVNSKVEVTGWAFLDAHYHRSYYGTYSYDFKPQLVTAGSHTVKIEWRTDDGTAYLMGSTLTVIAVPIP